MSTPKISNNNNIHATIPAAARNLRDWKHFAGVFGGEHIAATEFVIGAAFVAMGVSTRDLLLGLFIGNLLGVLSWVLLTTPIAIQTRLSLFAYLEKIAGPIMSRLFNGTNVLVYSVISAAMITVSASAVRFLLDIPAQLNWYPEDLGFVLVVLLIGTVVVTVATFGFDAMARFATICAPWMFLCFICGALLLVPALTLEASGHTLPGGLHDLLQVADALIWTGHDQEGKPGLGMWEVAGFAWASLAASHVGLIDMAIFRFAKRPSYGFLSAIGMYLGHYLGWICAGVMGAGTAVVAGKAIGMLDPGDVAYQALGIVGILVVIVAGWTTANACLYRAGLAAHAIFHRHSRHKVTFVLGILTTLAACFPFVYLSVLPILVYTGILVAPVGAIVMSEHFLFPRLGLTRYWAQYRGLRFSAPAIGAWTAALLLAALLQHFKLVPFYFIFIPEYLFAALIYTLLAARSGARNSYPGHEARQRKHEATLSAFENAQAQAEAETSADDSHPLPGLLRLGAWSALLAMPGFALWTLLGSDNPEHYAVNQARFNEGLLLCTLAYFAFQLLASALSRRLAAATDRERVTA